METFKGYKEHDPDKGWADYMASQGVFVDIPTISELVVMDAFHCYREDSRTQSSCQFQCPQCKLDQLITQKKIHQKKL